ncbi:hypothetical protein ACFFMR_18975 [Micromonospora andamanensis]|uniref:Uncharacterized protein n=1 Tax=Micromonospora andamanensis TaxID=1287068 RepID=A0ABQ4HYT0_9ACTN|nr:hypothetical protein [Micromonospora andamanensis]GIJ10751.1 hypothetical protein Van01_39650 [Micromonospora andamanensis]
MTFLDAMHADDYAQAEGRAATAEDELSEALDELREARTDRDRYAAILHATAEALHHPKAVINGLPAAAAETHDAAHNLAAQLDKATAHAEHLRDQIADLTDQRTLLRRQIDGLTADNTSLRKANTAYANENARLRQQATPLDTTTRDRIAADALNWAANHIDPSDRLEPLDEQHAITLATWRGTATNLRFWADQVLRGYIEPRPAGSPPHVTAVASVPPSRAQETDQQLRNRMEQAIRARLGKAWPATGRAVAAFGDEVFLDQIAAVAAVAAVEALGEQAEG